MSLEENKAVARRWMEEIWQKASPAAIDELLAPNFVFNYPPPGVEGNREAYKQIVKDLFTGFPDLKWTTADMVAEGDKVAVHWKGRGTHKGEWWGIPPTGKQATPSGISIIRIAGGKLVEEAGYGNMGEMVQQLGASK